MSLILLIEDEADLAEIIKHILEPEHQVITCDSATKAPLVVTQRPFQLILMDVELKDGNGFDIFARFKQLPNVNHIPVLFTTGRLSVADQVLGYSLGAEDYITKPFDHTLFRIRVNAKLKKYNDAQNAHFILGDLKFDTLKQKLSILVKGQETGIEFTSLEFKIIHYLAHHEEQVFSRTQLMTAVWGPNIFILDRTIDSHISRIRTKLKSSQYTIEPVHGVGYRLISRVQKHSKIQKSA
jgi:DNA-binding response OmpR family regulator